MVPLPRKFCEHLEWRLSGALSKACDKSLRRYWCDGILDPEIDADNWPILVRRSKQLKAKAWIDEGRTKGHNTRQLIYQLTINLGPEAFAAYVLGNSLDRFVPDSEYDNWVVISPDKQLVEVWLL